jgi:uncharacterized LabA/DUF88 family protein
LRRLKPIPENVRLDDSGPAPRARSRTRRAPSGTGQAANGAPDAASAASNRSELVNGQAGGPTADSLRLGIFIDTANVSDRSHKNPTVLDYTKLKAHILGNRRLVHARAYCAVYDNYGLPIEKQKTVEPIWDRGFDIVTKPVKVFADGSRKADLDLTLTIDIVRRMGNIDVLTLVSGDGDYVPLVDYVRENGIRVEVYSFVESLAKELRIAADEWHDLHSLKAVHATTGTGRN